MLKVLKFSTKQMCALCYVLSSVVLFSLYLLVGGVYPTIGMEYHSFKCTVVCIWSWGARCCYMTKRVRWKKKASLYVHSLKITKLSKWFFVLMYSIVYECYTRTIYCRPFTTLLENYTKKKYFVFSFAYIGVKFGACLDKSLRGFCNFNKLWLVILHYIAVFIENLGC